MDYLSFSRLLLIYVFPVNPADALSAGTAPRIHKDTGIDKSIDTISIDTVSIQVSILIGVDISIDMVS